MVGRGTLIVILGFSLIFGVASQYWNRESLAATDNFVQYYDETTVHNLAVSAANIAADSVFRDPRHTFSGVSDQLDGGTINMSSQWDILSGDSDLMVTAIGNYPGTYGNQVDTVQVILSPSRFSRFAFFSNSENGTYFITGDTLTGPYHTNGSMYLSGVPVIKGSVTTGTGTVPGTLPNASGDTLKCNSYQSGVNIPMPTSLSQYSTAATKTFSNTDANSGDTYDVYLTFGVNSTTGTPTVSFYTSLYTKSSGTTRIPATGDSTVALSTFESGGQGVILVNNGDVHVQGTLDGDVTVIAQQGPGTSANASNSISAKTPQKNLFMADGSSTPNGNVIIEGNIKYNTDPQTTPSSQDMLGLVADNSVAINTQTSQSLTIDAAVFARTGEFTYLNYNVGSTMGYLNLYGSISNNIRGPVGTFKAGTHTINTGYLKNYRYDSRLATMHPPSFPSTGTFDIVAWRE